jgi:hypothetical protein
MADRTSILAATTSIMETGLTSAGVYKFKNIQTVFLDEPEYPVVYVLAGAEDREARGVTTGHKGELDILVRIAVKQKEGEEEDQLNPLIEKVYELIDANPSLQGTVHVAEVASCGTDEGLLYPIAIAEIVVETVYLE